MVDGALISPTLFIPPVAAAAVALLHFTKGIQASIISATFIVLALLYLVIAAIPLNPDSLGDALYAHLTRPFDIDSFDYGMFFWFLTPAGWLLVLGALLVPIREMRSVGTFLGALGSIIPTLIIVLMLRT